MKRKISIIFLLFGMIFCLFMACDQTDSSSSSPKEEHVNVVAVNVNGAIFENEVSVIKRGEDLSLNFTIADGVVFDSCEYNGQHEIEEKGEGRYVLKLFNVQFDARITIKTNRLDGKVYYYLNGGSFVDETKKQDFFMVEAVLGHHLRFNTDIGKEIVRDGYTQLGWNTQPDGSGDHVGLGSRITINEKDSVALYAEWEKWSPNEYFTYATNNFTKETGDIILMEYHGPQTIDRLSIPGYINGKKVTFIGETFSQGLQINTLILPNTMHTVRIGSFQQSEIGEIFFFDNLRDVSNGSFGKTMKTIHINAAIEPRYMGESDDSQFSEDMDRLMLNASKKKMIFFGGCSMSYGLNSKTVEDAFNGEYFICDMAVIGGTNAWFQYLCMIPYLNEGDIFVHAPEEMSSYQLLWRLRAQNRMFVCVESNYDLLAAIDCSRITAFFECFAEYNDARYLLKPSSYEAYNSNYNEYGDIIFDRPNAPDDADFGLAPLYDLRYLKDDAIKNLNYIYGLMEERGAQVMFSFAPINRNALSEEDVSTQVWVLFENELRNGLEEEYEIISTAEDYLFEGKYFYDTDYHMSSEGAAVRTQLLIRDIKIAMGINEG